MRRNRVKFRASRKAPFAQPRRKDRGVQIQAPRPRRSTSRRIQSCSSAMDLRFLNGCDDSAAATSSAWTCVSIKPGITVRPRPSTTRVALPMWARTSSFDPTATNLPSRIASAVTVRNWSSTVSTRPSSSTRSAGRGRVLRRQNRNERGDQEDESQTGILSLSAISSQLSAIS